jgi:hypothetical protein
VNNEEVVKIDKNIEKQEKLANLRRPEKERVVFQRF